MEIQKLDHEIPSVSTAHPFGGYKFADDERRDGAHPNWGERSEREGGTAMKRLSSVIIAGVLSVLAAPAVAQTGGALEAGAKVCGRERLTHESQSEYNARLAAQSNMPDWIYKAYDKMVNAPDEMSFVPRTVNGMRVLVADGGVGPNSAAKLAAALDAYAPIEEVWLNSPGGVSRQGVLMGELLRDRQITTRVRTGDGCASACSTAFLGGFMRRVEPGALYGVHVYSSPDGVYNGKSDNEIVWDGIKGGQERTRYIQKMGIGLTWLDLWSDTHPGCMTFMSQAEMHKSFVNNID